MNGRVLFVALGLIACESPVHDAQVDALGPEAPGVSPGPTHRPGQPCTVCHGGKGPGSPQFDMAGTVFARADDREGVAGATVWLTEKSGKGVGLFTNEVGNFYTVEGELGLEFPLWTSVEYDGATVEMRTPIFRARACAECHSDPIGQSSVGHVYFYPTTP